MPENSNNTTYPFTLKDLKNAIPGDFFHGKLGLSLFYFFFDFLLVSLLGVGIYYSIEKEYYYFIPILSVLQGSMFWSIFVIGHDCGHASFSGNSKINYLFGLISHSFILVPIIVGRDLIKNIIYSMEI
jgi:omega-3 fatty acid desaturase (delta-15 desaturase)